MLGQADYVNISWMFGGNTRPQCNHDVTKLVGLEEAKPVNTPSVERTPTTESLVEERRAVYRTAVGKMLYMCQERAAVMFS